MIIYLIAIFATLVFGSLVWAVNEDYKYTKPFKIWIKRVALIAIIIFTISITINIVSALTSYYNYVSNKAKYDSIINQYRQAVTMYSDKAVINVKRATFTDLAYQGYQDNISNMIIDLRMEVSNYNNYLIKTRTYKENIIFSWMFIAPSEDMKLINLISEPRGM